MNLNRLKSFAANLHRLRSEDIQLEVRQMQGGMRASAVAQVTIVFDGFTPGRTRFVVKRLEDTQQREAELYQSLAKHGGDCLTPRFLGFERINDFESYLYLEKVTAWRRWPWKDVVAAGSVLEALAWIHTNLPTSLPFDNPLYEAQLVESAVSTVETFERAMRDPELVPLAKTRHALRRVVDRLAEFRQMLFSGEVVVLHGDVHPGNVFVRRRLGNLTPVLIDWESMRIGSPLEDVASWLQSLAHWEPQARRRHDTLLKRYFGARGLAQNLTRELRDHYWIAAACNGVGGALGFHLCSAQLLPSGSKQRAVAIAATRDWLRIIRRADECWGY